MHWIQYPYLTLSTICDDIHTKELIWQWGTIEKYILGHRKTCGNTHIISNDDVKELVKHFATDVMKQSGKMWKLMKVKFPPPTPRIELNKNKISTMQNEESSPNKALHQNYAKLSLVIHLINKNYECYYDIWCECICSVHWVVAESKYSRIGG